MTATVIIVTLNRPDCVLRCLQCLAAQTRLPEQIIVVDASPDDATRQMVTQFPNVKYLRNDNGYGRMTASRNIGLLHAAGDIIAFIDDDAFARDQWLEELIETYRDEFIGAVGGRVLNNQPGEENTGVNDVGRVKPNGTLSGNFAANTGSVVDADHIMGCNMSFRRSVLAECGGFREDYPGISGVREDTDMSLRVGRLGYRIVFNPVAIVDHLGAPQAHGRRFDARYQYFAARNHVVMLMLNYGVFSRKLSRYIAWILCDSVKELAWRIGGTALRVLALVIGTANGIVTGAVLILHIGRDAVRRDSNGEAIRATLYESRGSNSTWDIANVDAAQSEVNPVSHSLRQE